VSERAIHIGVLVSAIALAAWVFGTRAHDAGPGAQRVVSATSKSTMSPLSLLPSGSAFVLDADIARLVQAPLGPFLAERLGHLGRASELGKLCGFDPLARLAQLALAVPAAGEAAEEHADDFGIVATGRFSAAEITRCANAAIAQRGGEAALSTLGGFSSVRDRKGGGGEVAAKDGLLIVSGGSYFRELLDAADGNAPAREHEDARDARHAVLRRALDSGDIVATWLLSDGWFERVSGDSSARLSPLGAVKALGARLIVTSDVRVSVLLECADAEGATRIAALIGDMRASLGSLALAPALSDAARRIELDRAGAELRLSLTLGQNELAALFDALSGP
jgi:hypothetical protein